MKNYIVTIFSACKNHVDDVMVYAASPSDAIDYILETRSYRIKTLFCEDLEVNV
jgi:hypothetical protein